MFKGVVVQGFVQGTPCARSHIRLFSSFLIPSPMASKVIRSMISDITVEKICASTRNVI